MSAGPGSAGRASPVAVVGRPVAAVHELDSTDLRNRPDVAPVEVPTPADPELPHPLTQRDQPAYAVDGFRRVTINAAWAAPPARITISGAANDPLRSSSTPITSGATPATR